MRKGFTHVAASGAVVALLLGLVFAAPAGAADRRIDDALTVLDPSGLPRNTALVQPVDPIRPIGRMAIMLRETPGRPLVLAQARDRLADGRRGRLGSGIGMGLDRLAMAWRTGDRGRRPETELTLLLTLITLMTRQR